MSQVVPINESVRRLVTTAEQRARDAKSWSEASDSELPAPTPRDRFCCDSLCLQRNGSQGGWCPEVDQPPARCKKTRATKADHVKHRTHPGWIVAAFVLVSVLCACIDVALHSGAVH